SNFPEVWASYPNSSCLKTAGGMVSSAGYKCCHSLSVLEASTYNRRTSRSPHARITAPRRARQTRVTSTQHIAMSVENAETRPSVSVLGQSVKDLVHQRCGERVGSQSQGHISI